MLRITPAALTALLALALPSLAAAQTATDRHRDVAHDERVVTRDTTRLDQEVAVRDSARTALAQDHYQTQAVAARIDSLQHLLDRERAAKPRDAAAISRDEAGLSAARKTRDQDLRRDQRAASHLAMVEQKVEKESKAAIDVHHDIRQDRSGATAHPDSSRR
jgi:hypothetical protein